MTVLEKAEEFDADKVIAEFERQTKDVESVQRETLRRILEENASAEYLLCSTLNGRTDPESFKACLPLVTHQDMESYINRMIDGDTSPILTGKPITTMSLSSGTTSGKQKYVPWNDELFETTLQIYHTSFAFRNSHRFSLLQKCKVRLHILDPQSGYDPFLNLAHSGNSIALGEVTQFPLCREFPIKEGKALNFIYSSKQFSTKGGLAAGTATTHVFRNEKFKSAMKALQSPSCSPDEVIYGQDFHQSLYCHLLCGLIFREEVQLVSSTFAHSILYAFRTFEQVWEDLCTDIREGVLNNRVIVPSTRAAMLKLLKPNSELANLIHKKCMGLNKNNWYGLIPELFPNAKYVYGIMTGSMEPYLKKLRHYAGEIPLLTSDYGSCEGWVGTNISPSVPPEMATYVVLPQIGYFEFIPLTKLEGTKAFPQTLGLHEVKIGEEYEVVITNPAGLYRYKLGDVVKVMGFHNSAPKLKFVRRSNLLLTINIDKNTESDLQLAVEAASKLLAEEKLEMIDYTSYVDLSKEPGHYVIFWEISGEASDQVLGECCNCLDKSFADGGYITSRKINFIDPLELRVLRRGTFQKILDNAIGVGANANQFKTARCISSKNTKVLQILSENVVKSYHSVAFD